MKKSIFILLGFIGFSLVVYILISNYAKPKNNTTNPLLPILNITDLNNTPFEYTPKKTSIIVYFSQGCSMCGYQLEELHKNADLLANYELLFLSSAELTSIKEVSAKYPFPAPNTVKYCRIEENTFKQAFGSAGVPQILIYDGDRRLLKHFKGETKIEAILQAIP